MKLTPLEPGGYYHFYNRGNNKEVIFKSEENMVYFLSLVTKYLIPVLEIHSYCLLPNHFHFVIRVKDEDKVNEEITKSERWISQPFSNLFNAYTKAFNKMYNRTGSLFQKHPKRIRISKMDYLRNLIIYVNTNPYHHGIADFETYKFSSYLSLISNSPTQVSREDVIEMFDNVENFKAILRMKRDSIDAIGDDLEG